MRGVVAIIGHYKAAEINHNSMLHFMRGCGKYVTWVRNLVNYAMYPRTT